MYSGNPICLEFCQKMLLQTQQFSWKWVGINELSLRCKQSSIGNLPCSLTANLASCRLPDTEVSGFHVSRAAPTPLCQGFQGPCHGAESRAVLEDPAWAGTLMTSRLCAMGRIYQGSCTVHTAGSLRILRALTASRLTAVELGARNSGRGFQGSQLQCELIMQMSDSPNTQLGALEPLGPGEGGRAALGHRTWEPCQLLTEMNIVSFTAAIAAARSGIIFRFKNIICQGSQNKMLRICSSREIFENLFSFQFGIA